MDMQALVGDFRGWEAITSWAAAIDEELKEPVSAQGTHPAYSTEKEPEQT
jgi:hypothetical protein